jgi:hypothetical protein
MAIFYGTDLTVGRMAGRGSSGPYIDIAALAPLSRIVVTNVTLVTACHAWRARVRARWRGYPYSPGLGADLRLNRPESHQSGNKKVCLKALFKACEKALKKPDEKLAGSHT